MKLHPTVLVLAGTALLGLTGCGAVGTTSSPDTTTAVSAGLGEPEADDDAAEAPAGTSTATTKKPKHPGTATPWPTPTTHAPKPRGPRVVSFEVVQKPKCAEGTAVRRAEAVPLIIKWKVAGADSAALSVDDPTGTPGTYGPVDREGTQEFMFSCGGEVGSFETHTYAIYTVGGGAQKHKTLKVSAKVMDKGIGSN
ncbi:hypothetical protein [Actinoplanes sp. NPDC049599]|uniref:hypothetical protein n=1 Tax=Actinoplanes sp. NPDC049599 TaxID=3363903 RepID=UPI0037B89A3B